MRDAFRDALPVRDPNDIVWCERCQTYHNRVTFDRNDYDRVIAEGARRLAEAIDALALDEFQDLYR